jgi:N-acetylneuraminate synthase
LIDHAYSAGANAVKFQAYTPDTITLDCNKPDFIVQDGLWKGRTLYELYTKAHTPWDWFPKLFEYAHKIGITAFASVFDKTSVDMLERIGCPAYKIASFEIVDTPLIDYAAKTGKPLIISTGLASDADILSANKASGKKAAFLHCTSEYPAKSEHSDISRMQEIDRLLEFQNPIGLSDHTNLSMAPMIAVALGAMIIEKHLKLPNDNSSEDAGFSLNPEDFKDLVRVIHYARKIIERQPTKDNPQRQFKRSIYAVADIRKGEQFTEDNIRSIRPGYGLPPSRLPGLLRGVADRDYRRGDRIQ